VDHNKYQNQKNSTPFLKSQEYGLVKTLNNSRILFLLGHWLEYFLKLISIYKEPIKKFQGKLTVYERPSDFIKRN
jgi:hypothetical protein